MNDIQIKEYIQQLKSNIDTLRGWIQTNANNHSELADRVEDIYKLARINKNATIDIASGSKTKSFWELEDTPDDGIGFEGYNLVVGPDNNVIMVPDGQEDAFVVADIPARDALPIGLLNDEVSDGDIVKVLDSDGNGTEATYVWDETTTSWVTITQAGKVTPQIITGVTAIPTSVSPIGFVDYHLYMDTSAGDIDLSTLGTVAGVPDGGVLHFHNAGANKLLWTDALIGRVYDACLLGDIISLQWKADTAQWIIR